MNNKNYYINSRNEVCYHVCYGKIHNELLNIYEAVTGDRFKYNAPHRCNEEDLHYLLSEVWGVLLPKIHEQRQKHREEFVRKYGCMEDDDISEAPN